MSHFADNQTRADYLELIANMQPCTSVEIAELTGEHINAVRARLASMVRDGLVTIQRLTSKPNLYSLPGFTEESKPEPVGAVASPRQIIGSGTYTGPNWAQSAGRPGAMDHIKHPSRRGDVLVPHTGQMVSMVGVGK